MNDRGRLFLFYGDDEYNRSAAAQTFVDRLVPPERQTLELEIIDGAVETAAEAEAALKRCAAAVLTPGFLGAARVVWLREAVFLHDSRAGRAENVKAALADLVALLKEPGPGNNVLVISAAEVDGRTAFFRFFSERGQTQEFTVQKKQFLQEREAHARLAKALQREGLRATAGVQEAFLRRVGCDARQIEMEVEKLSVGLGPRRELTEEDVQLLASPTRDAPAWDLADALGNRDLPAAIGRLRDLLAQKESPGYLAGVLLGRVRELLAYREAVDRGWLRRTRKFGREVYVWGDMPAEAEQLLDDAFKKSPRAANEYRVSLLAKQALCYSGDELRRAHAYWLRTYERMVSGGADEAVLLEMALVRTVAAQKKHVTEGKQN